MRLRIWNEFVNAMNGDYYVSDYIEFQKDCKLYLKIISLVVSVVGLALLRYFPDYSWIAFVLVILTQIVSLFEKQIFKTDNDFTKILELRGEYIKYSDHLERLFGEFDAGRVDETKATKMYYSIREQYWPKITLLDNEIGVRECVFLSRKASKKVSEYVNQNYPS